MSKKWTLIVVAVAAGYAMSRLVENMDRKLGGEWADWADAKEQQ